MFNFLLKGSGQSSAGDAGAAAEPTVALTPDEVM